MHEARLRQLNELLPIIEANAAKCHADADDADALVRTTKAAIAEEAREHRHLRALVFIPAALGGGLALKTWLAGHRREISNAAGGVVTGAAATVFLAAALTGPDAGGLPDSPPTLAEPAPPLPPIGGNPPHVGPPKSPTVPPWTTAPNRPRPRAPAPFPSGAPGSSPSPAGPPSTPPDPAPSESEPDGDEATPTPTCRVTFPKILHHGILCGHLGR
jgi:hypothetical protein